MTDATRKARFRIGGMDCAACASKIETAVRRMPGIEDVAVAVRGLRQATTGLGGAERRVAQLHAHRLREQAGRP